MPKIKFSHIVSCSSEDTIYNSNNLLDSDPKKKFVSKNKGEAIVSVILQLEKSCKICSIDIGNANSAFIEIFVGRSSSKEQIYDIILPMSSFMTPMDAINMTNCSRVRFFSFDDLSAPVKLEKWDRVKVICTQPFNKNVQYGLTFIALQTKELDIDNIKIDATSLGKFHIRPESPNLLTAGSLFAKRKELEDDIKTITQEIKTTDKPKCAKINIKPSSSKKIVSTDTEVKKQMNRNRQDLFYDSDDDKNSEKVNKIVKKVKLAEEMKKLEMVKQDNSKKRKTNNTDSSENDDSSKTTKREKIASKYTQIAQSPSTSTSNTSKRKIEKLDRTMKKNKRELKPFNELLNNVVFTISGFVNPERGNIRQLGLNMGAKFKRDWDNTCTHLICAFANTPKFQQVRGNGKIVQKDWLYDCNTQRKRLPWRRYALDVNDVGEPESEDEIFEKTNDDDSDSEESVTKVNKASDYLSGSDTDNEIEKIIQKQKTDTKVKEQNDKSIKCQKQDESFTIETDEEIIEKKSKDISDIPEIFKTDIFYIDSVFPEKEIEKLERLIKAFNGAIMKRISTIVDFVITNKESIEKIKQHFPNAKFVSSEWILDCHDQLVLVPYKKYLI